MKPSNTNSKRRKKRKMATPSSSRPGNGRIPEIHEEKQQQEEEVSEEERGRAFNCLIDAFSSASHDEVTSAYEAAGGDANKAAVILSAQLQEDCGGTSASAEVGDPGDMARKEGAVCMKSRKSGRRQRSLSVSTGTVSSVLGKGYVGHRSRSGGSLESKGLGRDPDGNKETPEFLYSMLGDECQLDFGVIKDVFSQCGYDVEKALDTLLELSASHQKFMENISSSSSKNDAHDMKILLEEPSNDLADFMTQKCQLAEDSTISLSERELYEVSEAARFDKREGGEAIVGCDEHSSFIPGMGKSYLSQKVLESLFSVPENSKKEPSSMNWKRVVKKMEAFGQELQFSSSSTLEPKQNMVQAKEDDYQVLRRSAKQHWDTTKSYYQKAAAAYSRGERSHAAYLSEQGKFYSQKAHEADERASQEIFESRNKGIRNTVTIDLHGQHIKQAMRLLKLHLILFTYIPSIQFLTVITGCGTHGVGKGKLKQSVIGLMEKEGVEWSEENRGTVVVRLDGRKEYSFLQSESDSE